MIIHSVVALGLAPILPLIAQANEDSDARSAMFREWVYADSVLLREGGTVEPGTTKAGAPPVGEYGVYTTEDSVPSVARFYAQKAGLNPNAQLFDFEFPDTTPIRDGGVVSIRAHGDVPSVMLLRSVGPNTAAVTILYWTPSDKEKVAVSVSRGKSDEHTVIQLLLHRRK